MKVGKSVDLREQLLVQGWASRAKIQLASAWLQIAPNKTVLFRVNLPYDLGT